MEQSVLVTGAARGIGRAIAVACAARGANVAINYLSNGEAAEETAALAWKAGAADVLVQQADVADGPAVRALADTLGERWGKLDVVVNNAGFGCAGRLMDLDEAAWDRAFATHLKGAFHVCRSTVPLLEKGVDPCILNLSSVAGLRGLPAAIAYATVKGALLQFTRCLAWELADQGIRVNALCPGIIRTDFHAAMSAEAKANNLANRIPLHREGQPEQVAAAAMALIDNLYVTGEALVVDGGLSMRMC